MKQALGVAGEWIGTLIAVSVLVLGAAWYDNGLLFPDITPPVVLFIGVVTIVARYAKWI